MLQGEESPIAEPQPSLKWSIIDIINVTVQPLLNSSPHRNAYWSLNPFTPKSDSIDFTLSKARLFYSV